MVADDRQHQTKRLQWRANSLSDHRMFLHQLPLLRGQTGWFQDDRIRNRNFADVMDHASAPECGEQILWKTEVLSQRSRILRQTFTVAVRVGVFAFDTACEREQDRLGSFELIRSVFELQERAYPSQKFSAVYWPAEKIVRPDSDAFDAILFVGERCYQNDGDQVGLGIRLDLFAGLEPVQVRHDHIQQYQVDRASGHLLQSLCAIGHGD